MNAPVNGSKADDGYLMDQLAYFFLPAGLREHTLARKQEGIDFLQKFNSANIYVTLIGIFALAILFFGVYQPLLWSIDLEIKETRFLLLLFPEDLARQLPEVIAAGKRLWLMNGAT
jgi:hypothetical protein